MKFKRIILIVFAIISLLLISEIANYLMNPASSSSEAINRQCIRMTVSKAKESDLLNSMRYLSLASRINTFSEYNSYRNLLPTDYSSDVLFPEDSTLKSLVINYLMGINDDDISNEEDQGLGKIYYDLAVITYNYGQSDLAKILLKKAVYNNPEFASFHVELINYYFLNGQIDNMNYEIDYCKKFESAKTMCSQYFKDSIITNSPREFGFLKDVVIKHYLHQ